MRTLLQVCEAKGGQIYSIRPEARVIEALQLMAQKEIGALAVIDGERLVGIMSERDYARKVILLGRSSQDIEVRDIMTADVVTVASTRTVEECMGVMTRKRVRHLPIIEGGKLVGLVSIGDLVKEVIAEQEQTIRQLESYIHS
ncbi:MAG: CBS domain-containing protein [Pseudomonadota bacterium]